MSGERDPEEDGAGAEAPRESRRDTRRTVASGAFLAAIMVALVGAATEGLNAWLLAAIPVAVIAAALLVGERAKARRVRTLVAAGRRLAIVEALLANIPDPVIMVDRRAVVREANAAARALFPALAIGRPLSFGLRAPSVLDGIEAVARSGERIIVEYAERVPTERVFEVMIGPLTLGGNGERAPGGEAVVLFFRDLTSARRLETMRVDFVANVSHELRTPLASLLGFVETLQGPAREDAVARERFLGIMREQALRMKRLIDDLLQLSRIELRAHVQPRTPVDLAAVARETIDALDARAREAGMRIAFEAPEAPPVVPGDRDELLRVVENLVENAIRYGEGGDRIEVRIAGPEAERAGVRLSVRDFGPGIAADHMPRLTERFYRVDAGQSRAKGGTGLGLAIVKHIVARHRGRLTIESTPGEGALFTVDLPTAEG